MSYHSALDADLREAGHYDDMDGGPDEYDYRDAEDDPGDECSYCGRFLSWGGHLTPSGAVACSDCEVDVWGTESGRPAEFQCLACECWTAHVADGGFCLDCHNERAADVLRRSAE